MPISRGVEDLKALITSDLLGSQIYLLEETMTMPRTTLIYSATLLKQSTQERRNVERRFTGCCVAEGLLWSDPHLRRLEPELE